MPPKTSGRIPGPIGTRSWIQWLLQWHEYRFTIWRNSPHGTRNLLTRWVWFRHQTLCHQWRTGHPHHTFMKGCPLSCIWCHNPEGIRNGKDNYTQPRNASAVELVWKYVPTGHWHWLPRVLSPTNKNACYADAVPKNVRQWLSRYQERNIPPNTWCMK